MNIVSPVVPGLERYEVDAQAGHEQRAADGMPILRSPEGVILTRWDFTAAERKAIANGASVYLWVATDNQPFHPVKLELAEQADVNHKHELKRMLRLDDEFELRKLLEDSNKAAAELQNKQMALLSGDSEVKNLAVKAQKARQLLDRKKAEVFNDKPSKIEVVQ